MKEAQSNRFKDATWFPKEEINCLVGGQGGTGSYTSFLLARANFKPIIIDADRIEEHNIGGQLFRVSSIGKPKVEEMADVIKDFVGEDIIALNQWYTEEDMACEYMFSCFDSMAARKVFFENWLKYATEFKEEQENLARINAESDLLDAIANGKVLFKPKVEPILFDLRLGFANMEIYCVTLDRVEEYKKTLFNDDEVEDLPCTLKQTSHCAAMIASHAVAFFTNHIHNMYAGDKDFVVPFKWDYVIPINKVESVNI